MTIILFFAVLFVLILVHEWGHFIVAKKTGMRVDEFGIGFPPKLFSKTWRGTEYSFNLLPIGGFVRIFGENAEDTVTGTVPEDSFNAKSKWAQAAVLVAGVTMNIIFAWVLFAAVFMIGVPTAVSPEEATDGAVFTVTQVLSGAPADEAGVPVGAQIVSVSAGQTQLDTLTPDAFSAFVQGAETTIDVTYEQEGVTFTTSVTPEAGLFGDDDTRAGVGVGLALVENVRQPIHTALYEAMQTVGSSLVAITIGLGSLLVQSVQGTADFSQIAGPVGIVGLVGDAAAFGFTSLLMFTAVISLNLAVINMLPFPALDGGRLLMVAIEAVMRRPINPVWVGRVNLLGFALLMLLMIAVTWNDIARIL